MFDAPASQESMQMLAQLRETSDNAESCASNFMMELIQALMYLIHASALWATARTYMQHDSLKVKMMLYFGFQLLCDLT